MKKIFTLILAACTLSPFAFAANVSSNTQATATLAKSCAFSTAIASFGTFVPSATGLTTTSANINVICTKSTTYTITGDAFRRSICGRRELGLNGTVNGSDYLLYNIYLDPAYTQMLSYSVCSAITLNGTGTGAQVTHPLYLKMDKNQFVKPGSYSDAVPLTLTF